MSVDDRATLMSKERQQPDGGTKTPNGDLDDCSTRLSTFAEHLGLRIDALSSSDPAVQSDDFHEGQRRNSKVEDAVVVVTQEKVENLIASLEYTAEALKRLVLDSHGLLAQTRRRHRMPNWVVQNLLAITIVWQVLHIAALTVLEAVMKKDEKKYLTITVIVMVFFQSLNLLLVIFASIKLSKQIMHSTVTKSFFGQAYLSTILLYAGLYTLIFNIDKEAFDNVHGMKEGKAFASIQAFLKLLFFSVSNATLCGSANIVADLWHSQLICSTQMLLSYVYFASVMYLAVHPPKKELRYQVSRNTRRTYGTMNSV